MFIFSRHFRALQLTLLLLLFAIPARAQTTPVWESAGQIRDLAFQAQSELYAARASDPVPHHQAAADLMDDAAQIYAATLQPSYQIFAPEADALILDSLTCARTAALTGDLVFPASPRADASGLRSGRVAKP
ncbi:MAG: hypothetical protein IPG44_17905 [Anaerolineales bacterium]|nr:hypothetical protein [Anaerolineales bacterium]